MKLVFPTQLLGAISTTVTNIHQGNQQTFTLGSISWMDFLYFLFCVTLLPVSFLSRSSRDSVSPVISPTDRSAEVFERIWQRSERIFGHN